MRYLWAEDFNGDVQDQRDKLDLWGKYFGVDFRRDCIRQKSLEEALEYLDEHYIEQNFDAVLLDIRFPIRKYNSTLVNDHAVYDRWFQNNSQVLPERFDEYARAGGADASSGILLYLALDQIYGFDWRKIAFISANVDDSNIQHINFLEQILTRIRYETDWSLIGAENGVMGDKWLEYRSQYLNLRDEIDESGSQRLKELIPEVDCIAPRKLLKLKESYDLNTLLEVIEEGIHGLYEIRRQLNRQAFEFNRGNLKYSSVFAHFEAQNLRTPPAFVKPTTGIDDECWTFREWNRNLCTSYTIVRRGVIDLYDFLTTHIGADRLHLRNEWSGYYSSGNSIRDLDTLLTDLRNIRDLATALPDNPEDDTNHLRLFQPMSSTLAST